MSYPKKLKRGLEDLSPLFQTATRPQTLEEARPQSWLAPAGTILAIGRGDGSNFSAASLLAGMLFPCEKDGPRAPLLLTITDGVSIPAAPQPQGGLYRCPLSWTAFRRLCASTESSRLAAPLDLSRNVVLDFDLRIGFPEEALLPLLDKCLFWAQPAFENLSAIYKLIKSAAGLNPSLECYLVYEGAPRDSQGEFVFEKLAGMCSQHLGINLTWLGSVWTDEKNGGLASDLRLEHLWLKPVEKALAPEKIQLLRFAAAPPAEEGV